MQCSTTCLTTFLKFRDWSITCCQTFVNNSHHTMCVHHLQCSALHHSSTTMSVPVLLLWKQQASLAVISSSAQQLPNCRNMAKELARESIALDHKRHMWCPTVHGPVSTKLPVSGQSNYEHHAHQWQDFMSIMCIGGKTRQNTTQ